MAARTRRVRQPAIGATVETAAHGPVTVAAVHAHGRRLTVTDGNSRLHEVTRDDAARWLVTTPNN